MQTKTIAVIAFKDISPFHLSVPCIVFGKDKLHPHVPKFELMVCAVERGILQTNAGFSLKTVHGMSALSKADIIIVPSWRDPDEPPPQPLINALRKAHQRGAKIVGLCLGSFVLAAAGLLDGRSATTHWGWSDELQRRYPTTKVVAGVLYLDDGDILTSAGVAAGIDCCLHILRTLYGSEVANCAARRMVVPPHRQGGQAQYIEQPLRPTPGVDRFARVLDEVLSKLDEPHSLDALAQRALMSRSTFTRQFKRVTGTTVGQWLLSQRLSLAQRLLETTDKSIDMIAREVGFGSTLSLRQHFSAQLKTSPRRYRDEFRLSVL
jgi:transcriptional regulator GlxA family with amidase domain